MPDSLERVSCPALFFAVDGQALFGLAGTSELWKAPDGTVRAASIIATDPNDLMQTSHDKVPVIISPSDDCDRLDSENQDTESLMVLVRPFPADVMTAYPMSIKVSNAKNEGDELIEPAET